MPRPTNANVDPGAAFVITRSRIYATVYPWDVDLVGLRPDLGMYAKWEPPCDAGDLIYRIPANSSVSLVFYDVYDDEAGTAGTPALEQFVQATLHILDAQLGYARPERAAVVSAVRDALQEDASPRGLRRDQREINVVCDRATDDAARFNPGWAHFAHALAVRLDSWRDVQAGVDSLLRGAIAP